MQIKRRIFFPMIALTIVSCVAVLVSFLILFSNKYDAFMLDKVYVAMNTVEYNINEFILKAQITALALGDNRDLSEAIINSDRARIFNVAYTLKTMAQLDFCTIVDATGEVLIRVHDPGNNAGGSLAELPHVIEALKGNVRTFIVPGVSIRLGVMAGAPVYDSNGNIVGAISLGFRLDSQNFANKLKAHSGCDVTVFMFDERVSTTIKSKDGTTLIGTNAPQYISEKLLIGEPYTGRTKIFDKDVLASYIPLFGVDNSVVGIISVDYFTEDDSREILFFALAGILITLIILVLCLFIARVVSAAIELKLKNMQEDLNLAIKKAETANKAKSSFLANMSHEIRTPMNSIMGFAELAQDLAIVPQVKDYLSKISDSTKWLLSIINDILDISKIEAGKMELEQVPFDLHDVFSRCQSVILLGLEKKNLDLHINAEPSIGKKLLGDPVRLYQVLMNLLSNAVKFTNKGTIYLSSSIKKSPFQSPQPSDKTTVYFEVKDSGIGMTSEQIDKIFAPFIQADSSTTRDYGGTGLGLAISKNIVELMGGELIVKSSPDVGSIFCFEITFDTIDVFDDTSNQSGFDVILKPCFEGLVLVCDDNSMNQEVVCAHLAHVGLRTVTAENGKIGVEMVEERIKNKEKPFDMIFMDMFMPVMDGMEAASKIMALNTGSPIVAVTANVMASELEEYKRCGMQDYLGKPFTSQELWRTLLKYFVPIDVLPHARDHVDGYNNDELQRKLQINFLQNNQNVHIKIMEAVTAGDIQFAHRLAHSLKGNAGLLGKTGLKKAAAEVETMLKDRTAFVWETKMSNLSTELQLVFEELKPLFAETVVQEKARTLGAAEALVLFDKLEVMLKNLNPECLSLLDDLRIVTGTGELIQQIENYEFETASITLDALKGRLTHEEK